MENPRNPENEREMDQLGEENNTLKLQYHSDSRGLLKGRTL